MSNISTLIAAEATRWRTASVRPELQQNFDAVARRLVGHKKDYQDVESATGVPWFVIAVIHELEAGGRFDAQLGQGDPLDKVSIHVPKNRGPFKTFREGAIDALVKCAPKAASWTDWSIGGALAILNEYNGLGYFYKDTPSPYVWAGTTAYVSGKYTSDGHFDPSAVSRQLGCAGLLLAMQKIDSSIKFSGANAPVVSTTTVRVGPGRPVPNVPVIYSPPLAPSISHPAEGSIGDAIAKIFSAIFSHLHN